MMFRNVLACLLLSGTAAMAQGLRPLGPVQSQQLPAPSAAPTTLPAPIVPVLPAGPASPAPSVATDWLPRASVELQALDKVTARNRVLTGRVGEILKFGSLTIAVKSCVGRAPDQPQDAAVYLEITDSKPGEPGFKGWMLAAEPALSMMEHPVYDIRLTACRA